MTPSAPVVIRSRNVVKRFGRHRAVNGVSIEVRRGSIYGFLGPNGSGKTTFMRMLCGLLLPDSGECECLGFDVTTEAGKIRRRVGYMPQRFSLYTDLSAAENLHFVARLFHLDDASRRIRELSSQLGLTPFLHQQAGVLSGGWKQRLSLACCLLHRPEVLLLDEPTAGADPNTRRAFWAELHRLSRSGMTILVTTHYMDEAERCDEIAYVAQGEIRMTGSVPDFIRQSGVSALSVNPGNDRQLPEEITLAFPDVQVVPFGQNLHVSSRETSRLEAVRERFSHRGSDWRPTAPSFEDAFIGFMN